MGLREKLADDLKEAIRQRDETRKRTVRLVIAAIKQAETELDASGSRIVLTDDGILAVIARQMKQRRDSIDAFRAGRRPDLVAAEEAELAVLQTYLPEMTRGQIEAEARLVISEVGARGPQDLGKVMKPLTARLKDKADGRLINQVVRELLAG